MIDSPPVRRLNFGCGYDKRPGYVNVDSDPVCGPDVLILNNDLSPLQGEPFSEVLARDVLEHIPRTQTPSILLEWAALLEPAGRLVLQTSSVIGVARQLERETSFRQQYGWTICLFGNQAHPGDFHLTGFTELTLRVHLLSAGFQTQRMWLTDRWLLHAEATKVDDWLAVLTSTADADDHAFLRAAYQAALFRDGDAGGMDYFLEGLGAGTFDRREVLKTLMASPERLFAVANLNGFSGVEPNPPLAERVRPHIPNALLPPLQTMYRSAHSARARMLRAAGAIPGRRSHF